MFRNKHPTNFERKISSIGLSLCLLEHASLVSKIWVLKRGDARNVIIDVDKNKGHRPANPIEKPIGVDLFPLSDEPIETVDFALGAFLRTLHGGSEHDW